MSEIDGGRQTEAGDPGSECPTSLGKGVGYGLHCVPPKIEVWTPQYL